MNFKQFFAGMIFCFAIIVMGSMGAIFAAAFFTEKIQSGQAISIDNVEYRCGVDQ